MENIIYEPHEITFLEIGAEIAPLITVGHINSRIKKIDSEREILMLSHSGHSEY